MITRTSALALLTVLATSSLVAGCPKSSAPPKDKSATAPSDKPAATAPAGAKTTAKAAATKPTAPKVPRLSPEQRATYREALARGRKLAKQKKWADAVKAFSAALKILPMDGRALSEQGWAAYQIGDYALAREANARSVLAATEPQLKAASLYNLGRTAEALGKKEQAARYYRRSLKLRPHAAVEKRLVGLGKQTPRRSVAPEVNEPCGKGKPATLAAICTCLVKENTTGADKPSCAAYPKLKTHSPALRAIKLTVPAPRTETYFLLARQPGAAADPLFRTVAQIGYVYNPGAFGIHESFAFAPTTVRKLGERRLVEITSTKQRHDTDMGIDEFETRKVVTRTACLLPRGTKEAPRCVLQVPLEDRYQRDALGLANDKPSPGGKKRRSRLPIKQHSKVEVSYAADGRATIKLVDGLKTAALASKLGTHQLW